MSKNEPGTRYGIRVTMPGGDTMSAPHLLGDDWNSIRWFDSEDARDEALADMQRQPAYYRLGDSPTVDLEKVDQPEGSN